MHTLETVRLILRGWKTDDYLDFHEFISDEKVAQCAGSQVIKDVEESKNNIKLYISANQSYAMFYCLPKDEYYKLNSCNAN